MDEESGPCRDWWLEPLDLDLADPNASDFLAAARDLALEFARGNPPPVCSGSFGSTCEAPLERRLRDFVLRGCDVSDDPSPSVEPQVMTTSTLSSEEIAALVDGIDFASW
jgi:hypothetical protein